MSKDLITKVIKEGEGVVGHTINILKIYFETKGNYSAEQTAIFEDNLLALFSHGRQNIQHANELLKNLD